MGNRLVNSTTVKQGLYAESKTANGDIGSVMEWEDGRKFIYSLAAEGIVCGDMVQGPVEATEDAGQAIATDKDIAVGDTTVTITTGAEYDANQFQDGWLVIDDGNDGKASHMRKIKSHPAAGSGTSMVITVYDAFTDTAAVAAETISLTANPYNGVLVHNYASDPDGLTIGVAPIDVTDEYYFWLQVAGPCAVVIDEGTVIVGVNLSVHETTRAVTMVDTSNASHIVGRAMRSQATQYDSIPMWLNLR